MRYFICLLILSGFFSCIDKQFQENLIDIKIRNGQLLIKTSKDDINIIKEQTLLINKLLLQLFSSINIQLVDFKIEFGRLTVDKKIILADEISPDSCRLWDKSSSEKLDKDRFRKNLGGLIDAYKEVATRLGIKIQ